MDETDRVTEARELLLSWDQVPQGSAELIKVWFFLEFRCWTNILNQHIIPLHGLQVAALLADSGNMEDNAAMELATAYDSNADGACKMPRATPISVSAT